MIIKRYSRQLFVGTVAFCLFASSLSLSAKEWRFADSALTWEAVADCSLSPTPEGLKCTATGRDPHLKTQVDLPAGWNKITVDATAKGRLAGQFFWATREAGFSEQQSVPFDVRPGGSQPKRFQFDVFVSPKLPITELRFDPMSRKGQLVIHSITVSQEQPPQPQATPPESIRVPEGFAVELIYSVPNADQGSWVNMTTDPEGRLITSDQYGKLYRITPPAIGSQEEARIEQLDVDMGMCQGLLCAFDSLYAVVNGNANQGAGLYRLKDTNGDDQYDEVKLLRAFEGGGEHGPHAVILSPDGKSLYVCGGNHTKIPKPELSRVPRNWQEDQLLPRMWDAGGHAVGILAPGGWICRTDPDGETWELISIGFRNEYDIAFSPEGELFTYDADMEWDVGSPWYRPTRVNHVTSGSEFGWRSGTGKWPEYYPDSLGSVVDIGPGSPTGIVFGTGAKFPEAYQRALFISDWSYGIIYAVHLTESGATYTGEAEQFCAAPALQVSDVIVNPKDGALYFTIGGRRTQSGLYRVSYVGEESTEAVEANKVGTAIQMRRRLEQLHDGKNENTVELAMPMIGVEDRQLRFAARIALENRPVAEWRGAIAKAKEPRAIVNLAIALARCGEPSDQSSVLQALGKIDWEALDEGQKLDLLRAYGLALIRLGGASDDVSKQISATFAPHYPNDSTTLNLELCRLLVAVNDSSTAAKTIALLENAPTQEEQIHYALCLRALEAGWDQKLRTRYFEWFLQAASLRGGNSFSRFLSNIRDEAIQKMDPQVKEALAEVLDRKPEPVDTLAELKARPFVKKWTVQDLLQVAEDTSGDRDLARGEEVFATAQCYKCHRYAGKGGIVGPDLTAIGRRFNTQNLLESLIEPSKVISDQYAATLFLLDDGQQISGRVVNLNGENYRVQSDMLNPGNLQNVNRNHIEEMSPSTVSMMPEGLLDTFTKDEILDMLAYMRSATADPDALKKKVEGRGEAIPEDDATKTSQRSSSRSSRPPNIVWIISDDQSWTDYGFMGHPVIETPNLDRLAANSVTWTRGYVPTSLCRPSLATMITGRYPHEHFITGNDPAPNRRGNAGKVPPDEYQQQRNKLIGGIDRYLTLPDLLKQAGYASHQSGKWWEGNFARGGFDAGMTHGDPKRGGRHGDEGLKIGRNGMKPVFDFIDAHQDEPFFIWYAPFLPHTPHTPPKRLLDKYSAEGRPAALAKYYAMVEWFDETCGSLVQHLEERGLEEDTVIVYVTDNGWIQKTPDTQVPAGWRYGFAPGSKQMPQDGGVRTPIMISWPGHLDPKMDREHLVSSIDLLPTMAALAGVEAPDGSPGIDLLSSDNAVERRDTIFGEGFAHDVADLDDPQASLLYRWCIRGRWKLIESQEGEVGRYKVVHGDRPREPQLFDILADPHEQNDVAQQHPETVQELTEALQEWWAIEDSE